MLQAYLLTHQTEHGLVGKSILEAQLQRRALAFGEVVDIVSFADAPCLIKDLLLGGTRPVYLCLHGLVHLLPESRHARHTCRMGLAHRFLDLMRIDIDNERGTFCQAEISPAALKDMRERQEVDDAVFLPHRHTGIVGLESGGILTIGEHHAFRLTRRATGIEDIAEVVVVGLLPQRLNVLLVRQVLAQLDEVVEIHRFRVVHAQTHVTVEDDDTLQSRAEGVHTVSLVILLLLAHEDDAHACIVDHILYLLSRSGGIERDRDHTDTVSAKICVQVFRTVLGEDSDLLLRL